MLLNQADESHHNVKSFKTQGINCYEVLAKTGRSLNEIFKDVQYSAVN
jgi:hypothetical protein